MDQTRHLIFLIFELWSITQGAQLATGIRVLLDHMARQAHCSCTIEFIKARQIVYNTDCIELHSTVGTLCIAGHGKVGTTQYDLSHEIHACLHPSEHGSVRMVVWMFRFLAVIRSCLCALRYWDLLERTW